MKQCELDDFGDDEVGRRLFGIWDGYLIFCADKKFNKFIKTRGEQSGNKNEHWRFAIETCKDEQDGCAAASEVKKIVNSMQVFSYNVQK